MRTAPTGPDGSVSDLVRRARSNGLGDLLRRSAARRPQHLALIDMSGASSVTFAELDATVDRVANGFADRGVGVGSRVAILSRNSIEYVFAILGTARAGAVLVPVNFMLNPSEVAFVVSHSRASVLLAERELLLVAEKALVGLPEGRGKPLTLELGTSLRPSKGWTPFAQFVEHGRTSPLPVSVGPDDPAQILYTSGTESRPKGAVLTHGALVAQYATCVIDGGMDQDDVELHALPLFHCAQQHCFLMPDLQVGATSVVMRGPEPAALLRAVEQHRATKLFAPPTVWISLLRHPDFNRRDLRSLRKGYYGAAVMPVEVLRELAARLPEVRLWNFYGQTEMSPVATILQPEDQKRKAGSAGRAGLNVETRIVDENGNSLPPGSVGEIVHRSPHATLGYLDDADRTREAFADGWFHSGDLGFLDDDGYLTVVDRLKDMIKTGGENVASREVEEALYEHPDVAEVAVVGVLHPTWIEAVIAVVVTRPGSAVTAIQLTKHAREKLAGFKVPKAFVFADELPKNPSGKILKRELRAAHGSLFTS